MDIETGSWGADRCPGSLSVVAEGQVIDYDCLLFRGHSEPRCIAITGKGRRTRVIEWSCIPPEPERTYTESSRSDGR